MSSSQNKNVSEDVGSGALDVKLHPLVIINISDHFTRAKIRDNATRVFGALLGVQEGRNVEIFNSFELVCTPVNDELVFDTQYLERKAEASTFFTFHVYRRIRKNSFASVLIHFLSLSWPLRLLTPFVCSSHVVVKQVFPTYDILGWYSTGKRVIDQDIKLQKQVRIVPSAVLVSFSHGDGMILWFLQYSCVSTDCL